MWLNPQETVDLVTFTEEILNGKLHFLCSEKVFDIKYFDHCYSAKLTAKLYPKFSIMQKTELW